MLSFLWCKLTVRTELCGKVRSEFLGLGSLYITFGGAGVARRAGSGVGFFHASFPVTGVNGQGKFVEGQDGCGLIVVDHIVLDMFSKSMICSAEACGFAPLDTGG